MDTLPTWTDVKKKFMLPLPLDEYESYWEVKVEEAELMESANKLIAIFSNTMNEIGQVNEKIKTKELLVVAIKAHNRLTGVRSQAPHLFPGGYIPKPEDTSLYASYIIFWEFLGSRAAKNYQERLTKFIDKKMAPEKDLLKRTFFMSIAGNLTENIENSTDNKGFMYKIINGKGVTSFLIGTVHAANYAMTQNPDLIKAVLSSKELYTELGEEFFNKDVTKLTKAFSQLGGLFAVVGVPSDDPNNKLQFTVDGPLIELAKNHNIKNIPLETPEEQRSAMEAAKGEIEKELAKKVEQIQAMPPEEAETGWIELQKWATNRDMHKLYGVYECIQAWQNGNEEEIELIVERDSPSVGKTYLHDRTNKWSEELITKLSETDFPITIAVGQAHCSGEKGLAKIFQDAGLIVENRDGTPWHLPVKKEA